MENPDDRQQDDDCPGGEVAIASPPRGCRIRSIVTVEPVVFLYFLGMVSYLPTLQQYVYKELSIKYRFVPASTSNCTHGPRAPSELESQVQSASSEFMLIVNAACLPTGFLVTIVLGHYSDFKGRRLAMILPCVGGVLRAFLSMLVVYFRWNLYYLVAAAVIDSLLGGPMALLMATFSYVSDISSTGSRSIRILLVELAIGIGVGASTLTTGYIINIFGFLYSFLFGLTAHTVNVIFCTIYVKESVRPSSEPVSFFSLGHIRETFRVFVVDNGSRRRWKLILLLLLIILCCTVDIGSSDVTTFFLLDHPLCFSSILLGYYQCATYTFKAISAVVLLKLLHSCLNDTGLMILACVAGVAAQLLLAFSHNLVMVFMVPLISATESLLLPLCRSISSKLVNPQEMGALFAGVAFGQQLSSFLGGIFFNLVYAQTVSFFSGTAFLVATALFVIALTLAVVLHVGIRRSEKEHPVAYRLIN